MGVVGGAALLLGQVNMASAQTTVTGGVAVSGIVVCLTSTSVSVMGDQSAYNIFTPPPASTTTISVAGDQSQYNIFTPFAPPSTVIIVTSGPGLYNMYTPPAASTTTISVAGDQSQYNVIGDLPLCP
jgi:hypothetical protein